MPHWTDWTYILHMDVNLLPPTSF